MEDSERAADTGGPRTALLVDDDSRTIAAMSELATQRKLDLRVANTIAEARFAIRNQAPHIVLCDIVLGDGNGLELLAEIDTTKTDLVVLAGATEIDSVLTAMRKGALNYLPKPVDVVRLGKMLDEVEMVRGVTGVLSESMGAAKRAGKFGALVGRSPEMMRVYHQILRVASTDATVMVQGETGTGKELVAEAIVKNSRRRDEPFLTLNCGGVSSSLIESELFGHERGAFTGADRRHLGIFERAANGTLLLDEITEMPLDLQVRLLRVLENRHFTRVGGERSIATQVRVIAATNRLPEVAIREGKLREDLFYRLGTFPIHLPPLRDRPGDAILIAEKFVEFHNASSTTRKHLNSEAKDWIARQHWTGNVRELRNVIERGFIMADSVIDVAALENEIDGPVAKGPRRPARTPGEEIVPPRTPAGSRSDPIVVRVGSSIAEVEKQLILATLRHFANDKGKAALALGISVKTLYSRLAVYRESASSD